MTTLLLSSLYFILPAYIANAMPVIAAALKLPGSKPINKHLLGDHKTWRGLVAGYFGALITLMLQVPTDFALLDYATINPWLWAIPFGLGALVGDATKSYFKRRLGRKPGQPWFPWDQLDFVIGAYVFLLPLYVIPVQNLLIITIITPLIHFLSNLTAYTLGMKKVWW